MFFLIFFTSWSGGEWSLSDLHFDNVLLCILLPHPDVLEKRCKTIPSRRFLSRLSKEGNAKKKEHLVNSIKNQKVWGKMFLDRISYSNSVWRRNDWLESSTLPQRVVYEVFETLVELLRLMTTA